MWPVLVFFVFHSAAGRVLDYTHITTGASPADADLLGEPVGGRLLFAGEHTQSARLAYADGALTSGIREAKRLLSRSSVHIDPVASDQAGVRRG